MKVILDDEWYIEDDGNGYVLTQSKMQEVSKKDGTKVIEPVIKFQNYPPTLDSCIKYYIRKKVVDSKEQMTIEEYVNTINQKTSALTKAIKGE